MMMGFDLYEFFLRVSQWYPAKKSNYEKPGEKNGEASGVVNEEVKGEMYGEKYDE